MPPAPGSGPAALPQSAPWWDLASNRSGGRSWEGDAAPIYLGLFELTARKDGPPTASPDPTNTDSTISYTLSDASTATVKIYNSSNTLVRTLVNGASRSAGANSETWDGKNDSNVFPSLRQPNWKNRKNSVTITRREQP